MPTPKEVADKAEEQRYSLTLYCQQCTDQQLYNVIKDEKKRSDENPDELSEVGVTARVFLYVARKEYHRRLDERDMGVQSCPTCS